MDIAFQLMVARPVEAAEGMRSCGRDEVLGTEAAVRKIFHEFGHGEGELILRRKAGDGKGRGKNTAEIEAAQESDGEVGIRLTQQENFFGAILVGPENIGEEKLGVLT